MIRNRYTIKFILVIIIVGLVLTFLNTGLSYCGNIDECSLDKQSYKEFLELRDLVLLKGENADRLKKFLMEHGCEQTAKQIEKETKQLIEELNQEIKYDNFQLAIKNNDYYTVQSLLKKGAKANGIMPTGEPYIWFASSEGFIQIVKALIDNGADLNVREKDSGQTPLMAAAFHGHAEVARLLLDKGADVNAKDKEGGTALMYATDGHIDTVRLLLDHGADVNAKTKSGTTALSFAQKYYPDIAEVLKQRGDR